MAPMELPLGMASGDRDRSLIEYYLDDEGTTTTMYGSMPHVLEYEVCSPVIGSSP